MQATIPFVIACLLFLSLWRMGNGEELPTTTTTTATSTATLPPPTPPPLWPMDLAESEVSYGIEMLAGPPSKDVMAAAAPDDFMVMRGAGSRRVQCLVPRSKSPQPSTIKKKSTVEDDIGALEAAYQRTFVGGGGGIDGGGSLPCVKRTFGWWTYEVCFPTAAQQKQVTHPPSPLSSPGASTSGAMASEGDESYHRSSSGGADETSSVGVTAATFSSGSSRGGVYQYHTEDGRAVDRTLPDVILLGRYVGNTSSASSGDSSCCMRSSW